MSTFSYHEFPHPIRVTLSAPHRDTWERLASPGTWWTGAEKLAIARQTRAARLQAADPPWLRQGAMDLDGVLSDAAIEVVWRVAIDAPRLNREWAQAAVAKIGDAPLVELVGVVVSVTAIDVFAQALGVSLEPLPEPVEGEPSRERPESVGEAGAWVAMAVPWQGPNVGRALSLVPDANTMFMGLVMPMYAGGRFGELVWDDAPLSRPQVELVAARVSAVNECFY